MATPLSLYIPIKQDAASQASAQHLYNDFMNIVTPILTEIQIVHYARLILIPNSTGEGINSIMLITTFDGAMNPYLSTFWNSGPGFKGLLNAIAAIAVTHPPLPIVSLSVFENFINSNNLSQPTDLYQAYTYTVAQITED
ncbi:hypothetical protein LV89_03731 [Arcicella aurantiaca]|uniref:Uncharacterized protein n=1 Tax=Arcicella aurantiaca TaxID=591202 RepID=A0A316DVG0_9BACT|nr:hypothetical protein [Arcicella aurantiaca]PWK21438.1 hypothetical protein LV89_03731 [Arcicella aurantiaca]